MDNEFASHKLLDAVGDLALAGGVLHGRFVAHRPGQCAEQPPAAHALFADATAWRAVATDPLIAATPSSPLPDPTVRLGADQTRYSRIAMA